MRKSVMYILREDHAFIESPRLKNEKIAHKLIVHKIVRYGEK